MNSNPAVDSGPLAFGTFDIASSEFQQKYMGDSRQTTEWMRQTIVVGSTCPQI